MSATRPPLAYLVTCSEMSLESVELSRLNQASNLRKEFLQVLEEWIDSEVDARLARSILDWKRKECSDPERQTPQISLTAEPVRFEQLQIAFLPESSAPGVQSDAVSHLQSKPKDRRNKTAPTRNSLRARTELRNDDAPPTTKQRPMQLARAVETKLREAEILVGGLSRRSSGHRKSDATNTRHELSCRQSAASSSLPMSERSSAAIELVPRRARRDELSPSASHSIHANTSQARGLPVSKRSTAAAENQARLTSPASRAKLLPGGFAVTQSQARQAG